MLKTILISIIIVFILSEIILGLIWGFGNPLIYIKDEKIGYLLSPNQIVKRNGNLIKINKFSMRSDDLNDKNNDDLRILLLGDSIVNGGWWTNQNQTISSLLENLTTSIKKFDNVEVLNVSANSWGARNELAYLEKYGIFQSDMLILVLNTDDFFALKPSANKIGKSPNYPDKKPLLAIQELLKKISGRFFPPSYHNAPEEGNIVQINLDAVENIKNFTINNNCEFFLVLTPLKREVLPPYSRDYELKARAKLIELVNDENIKYLDLLTLLQENQDPESLYHDHIHFNFKGNEFIAEQIFSLIKPTLLNNE